MLPADDYVRVVGVVGKQYQVHWLYTPDSYDTLLSTSELRGAQLDKLPLAPPYHVSTRWVEDTSSFNEWMNEKDYEVISKDGQLVPTAPYLSEWTEFLVLCYCPVLSEFYCFAVFGNYFKGRQG